MLPSVNRLRRRVVEVAVELDEVVATAISIGTDNILETMSLNDSVVSANLAVRSRAAVDLPLRQLVGVLGIESAAPVTLLVEALGFASGTVILGEDDVGVEVLARDAGRILMASRNNEDPLIHQLRTVLDDFSEAAIEERVVEVHFGVSPLDCCQLTVQIISNGMNSVNWKTKKLSTG